MKAVQLRNGFKYYGKENDPNKKIVLNSLNMTVYHGSIYGLLGASGCGKTTLLSCIVGRKNLNSGQLKVLGGIPGSPGSGVPGPRIGYMPQDIALVEEFSVKETIYYFGRIYNMSKEKLRERYKLLRDLLDLPQSMQQVGQLSGGQQRRVSLAAAMVHGPELLILDEPTVGLDPILREKIWDFLVETTRTTKTAVLITTHYIEEAKQANCIGLMRNGVLLAEDSPQNILNNFACQSLEDAFLKLCMQHGDETAIVNQKKVENMRPVQAIEGGDEPNANMPQKSPPYDSIAGKRDLERNYSEFELKKHGFLTKIQFTTKDRMSALLHKNFLQMIRQPAGLIFTFLYPLFQIICFYVAIGENPKDLKLGIVSDELTHSSDCFNSSLVNVMPLPDYECDLFKISCRFLNQLNGSIAGKVYFDTFAEAYHEVEKGKIIGFIHFASNFTQSLVDIRDNLYNANPGSFDSGDISVYLDNSDQQITFFLERKLRELYQTFAQSVMEDCNYPKQLGTIPIQFMTPVYGHMDAEFQEYMAPGVVMTMIFFLATLTTATIFITDRTDGIWDRTLVAGITKTELLMAHIVTQTVIMLIQCTEIVLMTTLIFDMANAGSNATVIILLLLLGFAGMLYGLFISIFCDSHTMANFMTTGSFYPMIILCGIFWPLEGMYDWLKWFAYFFPFTVPSISMRNILMKGWGLEHPEVLMGYGVVMVWIVTFFSLCLLGLKIKH